MKTTLTVLFREHEMNLTYNPTLKTNSTSPSSSLRDFATSSIFTLTQQQ